MPLYAVTVLKKTKCFALANKKKTIRWTCTLSANENCPTCDNFNDWIC